jgi:hypothetical protein
MAEASEAEGTARPRLPLPNPKGRVSPALSFLVSTAALLLTIAEAAIIIVAGVLDTLR